MSYQTRIFRILSAMLLGHPALAQRPPAKGPQPTRPAFQRRWVYISANLQVSAEADRVEGILRRAKAAGYNGIVLSDYKMSILDQMGDVYTRNARRVRETAGSLGLNLIAAVCPIGYSNGLLNHDPNLIEGLPVRDAAFVVQGQSADIVRPPVSPLPDGGFEASEGNKLLRWDFQDAPGAVTFLDTTVKREGRQSLRMENIAAGNPPSANARVFRKIAVAPFRQVHISAWVKTDGFETPGNARVNVLTPGGQPLLYNTWSIQRTQDWTQYHAVFNSLDNREVLLYLGVWGGRGGRIWWDDVRLEEVGLLNVIRRDGCPLTVTGADGTAYEEGKDFEPVRDERMGAIPWPGEYEVYHAPPVLRLTPGTRIRDGEALRVSFHHAITVHEGQAMCCLSHPRVYELLKDQVERVNSLFQPQGFLMSHDEIRVANWCDLCKKRNLTPGQMLADNVTRCAAMVRAANPKASLFVWSDMFDPHHNARTGYYLVNGDLSGSWEGLDPGITVLNWNFGERAKSAKWFADRGHAQVLAAYYDESPGQVRDWLSGTAGVRKITGVMYTTWQNRYDDLEAFAKAAGF